MLSTLKNLLLGHSMLTQEEKKELAQRLSALRSTVEKMEELLKKDDWKNLCDLHVEMDALSDALYDDINNLLVKNAYQMEG